MRELENEVALLKKKLNSSKQEKEKDVDDVKGELNISLNISNNITLTIIATSGKDLEPVKHEKEGEGKKVPTEAEGIMK